jgi:hypothetical protein
MAALSIAGAAIGVQLGRSAIAEINPVYFSTPQAARFFADLTPNAYRPGTSAWSESTDLWFNELNVSGRSACLDCSRNFIEPETVEATLPDWDEPAPLPARTEPDAADPAVALRASQIERYASFPVTAEEARERSGPEALAEDRGAVLRHGDAFAGGGEEEQAPVGM